MTHASQLVCEYIRTQTSSMRKFMQEHRGYELLLQDYMSNPSEDILKTLASLSADAKFAQSLAHTQGEFVGLLHDIFFFFEDHRKYVITIALNMSAFLSQDDITYSILPMLSRYRLTDSNGLGLFLRLLSAQKLSTKWMRANKWIFDSLADVLQTSLEVSKYNEKAVLSILHRCAEKQALGNFIKTGIWTSRCRKILFRMTADIRSAMVQDACTLLRQSMRFQAAQPNFILDLDLEEIGLIHNCLIYDDLRWFGVDIIHHLCHLDAGREHSLLNEKTAWMLCFAFDKTDCVEKHKLLFDALVVYFTLNPYHIASHMFLKLQEFKCLFSYNYADMKDEQVVRRLQRIAMDMDVDMQEQRAIQTVVQEMDRQNAAVTRMKDRGIDLQYPNEFKCPITQEVMKDPVVASDGFSYEREALVTLFKTGDRRSPLTRERLNETIKVPNINLKKRIREYPEHVCSIVDKIPKTA